MRPVTRKSILIATTLGLIGLMAIPGLVLGQAQPPPAPLSFLRNWGSEGSRNGQLNQPQEVAVDRSGNVYVADEFNHRVQVFDSTGTFLRRWGSQGVGDGQFFAADGIALDPSGNVYVADRNLHRVQVFDSRGNFLRKWGSEGSGDGELKNPRAVAVDQVGNVYVADWQNHRVQVFDGNGRFLRKWGSEGTGNGQFNLPIRIALDGSGNVYVADWRNHRVQVFDSRGRFLRKFGSLGTGNGQFRGPMGVAVDATGNVYVTDQSNHRVQVFDSTGRFLGKLGSGGTGNGQFNFPGGIALDGDGNIYVTDLGNHRIQVFTGLEAVVELATHVFTAKVIIDGRPAPDGTLVSAVIGGAGNRNREEWFNTTVLGGGISFEWRQAPDVESFNGEVVDFWLSLPDGQKFRFPQTAIWQPGGETIITLEAVLEPAIHVFSGQVLWRDDPPADGTRIVAIIDGEGIASAVVTRGNFRLELTEQPGERWEGKTIEFVAVTVDGSVGGATLPRAVFIPGRETTLTLDIQDDFPHVVSGEVVIDGRPAPDGTSVVASVGGVRFRSTQVDRLVFTVSISPPSGSFSGQVVEFEAVMQDGRRIRFPQTITWQPGGASNIILEGTVESAIHVFRGKVSWRGGPPANGTRIVAIVDGGGREDSAVRNGTFRLELTEQPGERLDGKTVEFIALTVDGSQSQATLPRAVFRPGGETTLTLDIQDDFPHVVSGEVVIDGRPAPDGTSVVASVGGVQFRSTQVDRRVFTIRISPPTGSFSGQVVKFEAVMQDGRRISFPQTITWQPGGASDITLEGAVEPATHVFQGKVLFQGGPPADGTRIVARVDRVERAAAVVRRGAFRLEITEKPGERLDGKTIVFGARTADGSQSQATLPRVDFKPGGETAITLEIQGAFPHVVNGKVVIDGRTAPAGTSIAAFSAGGVQIRSGSISRGEFSLVISSPSRSFSGQVIKFEAVTRDGRRVSFPQTIIWQPGGASNINLRGAVEPASHVFQGIVQWRGGPAADGTGIIAIIDRVEGAAAIVRRGSFRLELTEKPGERWDGKTIEFRARTADGSQTQATTPRANFKPGGETTITLEIQGAFPHVVNGKVVIDGRPAPDGTSIAAFSAGGVRIRRGSVSRGEFSLTILPTSGSFSGQVVKFEAVLQDGRRVSFLQTITWQPGGASNINLLGTAPPLRRELTITCRGEGTVAPQGCGTTTQHDQGTSVRALAQPAKGWSFQGFSGSCQGTGPCSVTMDGDKTLIAEFAITKVELVIGCTGRGAVSRQNCGEPAPYEYGSTVTLVATPAEGSFFSGWSGACTGSAPICTVVMDGPKNVTAGFSRQEPPTPTPGGLIVPLPKEFDLKCVIETLGRLPTGIQDMSPLESLSIAQKCLKASGPGDQTAVVQPTEEPGPPTGGDNSSTGEGNPPPGGEPDESGPSRGFFTNSSVGGLGTANQVMDPTMLAVIGILITLIATTLQMVRGS